MFTATMPTSNGALHCPIRRGAVALDAVKLMPVTAAPLVIVTICDRGVNV